MLDCAFPMLSAILVGFERILTIVDEDIGSFELCIQIFTSDTLLRDFNISLDLSTVSGTAGMLHEVLLKITQITKSSISDSSDYTELNSANSPLVPFTSDPSTHRQCFNVTINDDEVLEDTERFSLSLALSGDSKVPVLVTPDNSTVEIVDGNSNIGAASSYLF